MATVLSLHLGATKVHAAVAVGGRIDVLALDDAATAVPAPDLTDGRALVRLLVDVVGAPSPRVAAWVVALVAVETFGRVEGLRCNKRRGC